jgi:hypothetical protein
MKGIVDAAIPILSRLTEGEWWNLIGSERVALAAWVTLFVMSYEFADRETATVSFRERSSFRESRRSSPHWYISIGVADPKPGQDPVCHRALGLAEHIEWDGYRKACVTSLLFDRLLVTAIYAEFSLGFEFDQVSRMLGLHPLWPETVDPIARPLLMHTSDTFWELVPYFTGLLQGMVAVRVG